MINRDILLNGILIGLLIYLVIGIVVVESVETIKIGYQISALNRKLQKENFKHAYLLKKYSDLTNLKKVEEIAKKLSLKFPDPEEIVFVRIENEKR
ncbi:MAG: hypothetical protein J7L42_02925 [Elusimicrobia bacterium]|nr:hypothetical protein [Elusimicrobiota bacterium]